MRNFVDLRNFRPHLRAIVALVDETSNWADEIQEKARGKIYGVYLIDLSEPTHLCEYARSYPAYFIANHFENVSAWQDEQGEWLDGADNELSELEGNCGGEWCEYFSENNTFKVVDKILYKPRAFKKLLADINDDPDKAHSEWIENLLEYYAGNSPV